MRLPAVFSLLLAWVLAAACFGQTLDEATTSRFRAPQAPNIAAEIKRSGPFRDPGAQESSNWLGKAVERLVDALRRQSDDETEMPEFGLPGYVRTVAWGLLALAGAAFAWFAWRHFAWKRGQRRRGQAVLLEDEPDRSETEWLSASAELESRGDLRGAVRAIYLAMLVRIDRLDIARFDRSQTNWEHLARFERSPKRRAQTDFRRATRTFDSVWYGHRPGTPQDLAELREAFRSLDEEAAP